MPTSRGTSIGVAVGETRIGMLRLVGVVAGETVPAMLLLVGVAEVAFDPPPGVYTIVVTVSAA